MFIPIVLCCLFLLRIPAPVSAQNALPSSIFYRELKQLSARSGLTFVIEGQPYSTKDQTLFELKTGDSEKVRIRKIASAFDYEPKYYGTVVEFHKKYTSAEEIPFVTVGEWQQTQKDILLVLSAFSETLPKGTLRERATDNQLIGELINSLTPSQMQQFQSSNGISIAALSESQRRQALGMVMNMYLRSKMDSVQGSRKTFESYLADPALFRWLRENDLQMFGVESKYFKSFIPFHPSYLESEKFRNEQTIPVATIPPENFHFFQGTIQSALNWLQKGSTSPVNTRVNPVLSEKPVTIIRGKNTTPKSIALAIASVYGLRVKQEENGSYTIERKRIFPPKDIAELPERVLTALPEPIVRHMKIRELYETLTKPYKTGNALSRDIEERQKLRLQIRQNWEKQREEARAKLEKTVYNQLKRDFRKSLPFTDLDNWGKATFISVYVHDSLDFWEALFGNRIPVYVRRLNECIIQGTPSDDTNKGLPFRLFSIYTMDTLPDGSKNSSGISILPVQ